MNNAIHATVRAAALSLFAVLAAGCTTQIHNKDATIQASKVPLGQFSTVLVSPLVVEKSEGDAGDQRAIEHVKTNLDGCFKSVFKTMTATTPEQTAFAPGTLVIEPAIEDLKKITGGERFFAGALAGSSAILLRTRYRDGASGDVLASPVFYSKGNAMGGAWTFGATDNAMLNRVVELACGYARSNY